VVSNSLGQTDSKESVLSISELPIPLVNVAPVTGKVDPNTKLVLRSSITGDNSTLVSWGSADIDLLAAGRLDSPTDVTVLRGVDMSCTLIVNPGALSPGVTYVFQLRARFDAMGKYGESSSLGEVSVTTNSPPSGGVFSVFPLKGEALNTTFALSTHSWADDPEDYPLMYSFKSYQLEPSRAIVLRADPK